MKMAKLICFLAIIIAVSATPPGILSTCDDATAIAYGDTKCFKVLDNYLSWGQAFEACRNSPGQDSRLATIHSQEEQEFLANFLFNFSSVQNNVWIGASRNSSAEPQTKFHWVGGKTLAEYANWAPGNPTETKGRDCVQMQSGLTREDTVGLWKDVTCGLGNWAVCESFQVWSPYETQLAVIELREAMKKAQNNPVPIGFIYVQLPHQPEPSDIWPQVIWEDVTPSYAGQFFRAEGSGSARFGENQGDSTRQLSAVETKYTQIEDHFPESLVLPESGWSGWGRSAHNHISGTNHVVRYYSARFHHTNVEVRPKNTAIRLWKRTA